MTRVTNFGRKRTYVEAGFNDASKTNTDSSENVTVPVEGTAAGTAGETISVQPPKKKRKRTKKSKRDGKGMVGKDLAGDLGVASKGVNNAGDVPVVDEDHDNRTAVKRTARQGERKAKKSERGKGSKGTPARVTDSENRRKKRIAERYATTICFACRAKGHAAKDCPVTPDSTDGRELSGGKVLGICYRCGSTRHTLSRCKKPANATDPLPFASCFVCTSKGHLASACPQNKAKGIYPNGGCCKLCGDTSHLAKDCGLRKQGTIENTMIFGVGREAGADEDDFHSIKRRKTEVEREQRQEDKIKQLVDVKVGSHSGVVKSFGRLPIALPKKVVYF